MTLSVVGSLADIKEGVAVSACLLSGLFNGHVLHLHVFFRSLDLLGNLYLVSISFGPCLVAALQGVYLAHIISQCRQHVGGSLGIGFSRIADDHQVVVVLVHDGLHSCHTGLEVASLGCVHVHAYGAGNAGGLMILCLADIQEGITVLS